MIYSDVIDGILIISGFFIFSTENVHVLYTEELLHAIKDRFSVGLMNSILKVVLLWLN